MKNLLNNIKIPIRSYNLFLPLFLFIIINNGLYGQISEGGTPPSFSADPSNFRASIPMHTISGLDTIVLNQQIKDARKDCKGCRKDFYGKGFDVSIDLIKEGMQMSIPSGTIWRYKIKVEDALGVQLYFKKFELPDGGTLFIYNNNRSMILGAFTSKNNKDKGEFAVQPITGNLIIVEYFEPVNASFRGKVEISKVIHVFKDILAKSGPYGSSDYCHIDVACSLGNGWNNEIRSVGLMLYPDEESNYNLMGVCSGALINNTLQDARPYFLTAYHCTVGKNNFEWVVLFNHQESICGGNGNFAPTNQSISGAWLKSTNLISDHTLLELCEAIPPSYNACFAGWNRTETDALNTTQTTGIHHPGGDIKKISRDNSAPVSTSWWNISDTHWGVSWDQGITSPGSSGSPLFNSDHKIIGQLHGGDSECTDPQAMDLYGKFSRSWIDGNLGLWLSPLSNTAALNTYCPVYPVACANGIKDFTETGIDCGGSCPPCPPSCSDGIKNGEETAIDCGGSCPPCPPTCWDYIMNGGETGVDCGGPCAPCPVPSCTDRRKNQDETGIDCGGTICQPCSTFCHDDIKNGDELEKDCGGSCVPCYSLLTNGSFEDLTCTPYEWDDRISWGFTIEDKCVAGNWYATHGHPGIRNWEDGTHSLRFYSNSWPEIELYQSDGLFYQFESNLDPTKSYTLHFKAKVYSGTSLDACEFAVAKGFKQSHKAVELVDKDWLPPLQQDKCRIGIWDGTWSYTSYKDIAIDFTVPDNTYNQLWIHPFQYKGNGPVYFYVDDLVVTVHSGTGSTANNCIPIALNPCTPIEEFTNTSSLPALVEAIKITAGSSVTVLSGQSVHFKATNEVTLNPGFMASDNSVFLADITRCGESSSARMSTSSTNPNVGIALEPDSSSGTSMEEYPLDVFPNPTSGVITIKTNYSKELISEISVCDLYGQKTMIFNLVESPFSISLHDYIPGIYIVKVTTGNKVVNKKIILTK